MQTHTYPTDLTDAEWARLEPLFPAARTGHPRHHSLRTIVNALLYVLRTGCAWRLLPPIGHPGRPCTTICANGAWMGP